MNINNMASIIGDKSIKKEYLSLKRNILDNEDKIESILRKLQIEIAIACGYLHRTFHCSYLLRRCNTFSCSLHV